jgi:hypothetical protein
VPSAYTPLSCPPHILARDVFWTLRFSLIFLV